MLPFDVWYIYTKCSAAIIAELHSDIVNYGVPSFYYMELLNAVFNTAIHSELI